MKTYTLGEVIDNMKLDEVAIKVKGKLPDNYEIQEGHRELETGLFFDENDGGVLKSLSYGGSKISIVRTGDPDKSIRFVIIPRSTYEKLTD